MKGHHKPSSHPPAVEVASPFAVWPPAHLFSPAVPASCAKQFMLIFYTLLKTPSISLLSNVLNFSELKHCHYFERLGESGPSHVTAKTIVSKIMKMHSATLDTFIMQEHNVMTHR
jgi:hypothetical protein